MCDKMSAIFFFFWDKVLPGSRTVLKFTIVFENGFEFLIVSSARVLGVCCRIRCVLEFP